MNYIGGKWKVLILLVLSKGTVRYGKLHALLQTISKKVLTEALKELEEDGLIIRTYYQEKPPRVEYALSEAGLQVLPVLEALRNFGNGFPELLPTSSKAHCYEATA
ncbi:transcriptional regulator, HxlR family [Filimonas lacunae]|nr:transcriptional regulator, HxlR family [Filimonas lacunae]